MKKILSMMLGALGLIGLVSGCLVRARILPLGPHCELPLADLMSIAVDSKGEIFCASAHFARIQRYDSHGEFLNGWSVDTNGGVLALRLNEIEHLEVFIERGDTLSTFDRDGRLLQSFHVNRDGVGPFNGLMAESITGTLAVENRLFAPQVVRTDGNGNTSVLISSSFPKSLIMGPIAAWAFLATGLILWPVSTCPLRSTSGKGSSNDLQEGR